MNLQRNVWLVAVALVGTLTGCLGGSGSSGFDITEDAAIQQVIDTQECQDFEGLRICPADSGAAVDPSATPTPTLTPIAATPPLMDTPTLPVGTPGPETTPTLPITPTATERAAATQTPVPTPSDPPPMQIETNLSESSDIVCAGGEGSPCSFVFFFVAIGFPPDAIYQTAFREGPDQPWTLSQPTEAVDSQPGQASFVDNVPLAPASNAPSGSEATVQFAVLVFLSDPGELPTSVTRLGDTGASFAYVIPPVPVSTISAR